MHARRVPLGLVPRAVALHVLLLLTWCPPVWAEGKRYAVVVGVNGYDDAAFTPLEYAEADAIDLGALLERGGYKVTLLTGAAGRVDPGKAPTNLGVPGPGRPGARPRGVRRPAPRLA